VGSDPRQLLDHGDEAGRPPVTRDAVEARAPGPAPEPFTHDPAAIEPAEEAAG